MASGLACLALLHFPATAAAGEIVLTPGLALKQEYNDNIYYSTAGGRGDFITTCIPGLSLADRSERYSGSLSARVSLLQYLHYSRNSSTGYQLQGTGNYAASPRLVLSGDAAGSRDVRASSIDPGTGLANGSSVRQEGGSLGARYTASELTSATLDLQVARQSYDDPGFLTSRQYQAVLGLDSDLARFWQGAKFTPKVSFSRDATAASRVDTLSATLGLTKELHELWQLALTGGARYTQASFQFPSSSATGGHDESGWLGGASLGYHGETLSGSGSFSHDLTPASGRGGATPRTGGSLALSKKFTGELSGQLAASYSWNRSSAGQFSAQGIDETSATLTTGVRYELVSGTANQNNLAFEAGYSFSSINYQLTGAHADQNIFMLSVTWQQQNYH